MTLRYKFDLIRPLKKGSHPAKFHAVLNLTHTCTEIKLTFNWFYFHLFAHFSSPNLLIALFILLILF